MKQQMEINLQRHEKIKKSGILRKKFMFKYAGKELSIL